MKAERSAHILTVHNAESGLKLLRFLERRLGLPSALLHRWLRTGQIRRNGGRAGPFARVDAGDGIRLPPFALSMIQGATNGMKAFRPPEAGEISLLPPPVMPGLPAELEYPSLAGKGRQGDIWALYKPPGLPTHGGTGHRDSLAARLAALYAGAPFVPVPAHRLDKDTSGLLLAAATYAALRTLHGFLREGRIVKEYLTWVCGRWPFTEVRLLRHYLSKRDSGKGEKTLAAESRAPDGRPAREALCLARLLQVRAGASLLQIRLLTGRTHQIRAQLAALGHPVQGDTKYGGSREEHMYLHAARIVLPDGAAFTCPPPWRGGWAVEEMPEIMTDVPGGSSQT